MSDYFTGCTHFGHHNIMKYCDRPFESVEEMDDIMLQNFTRIINPSDTLWVLGDFCFGNFDGVRDVVRAMPTKNISLVVGNHDRLTKQKYRDAGFNHVVDYHEISRELAGRKRKLAMFHYPIHSWNGKSRGSWHLHSHTHNSMPDNPTMYRMNVGVDVNNFCPVSLEEVEHFMSLKEIKESDI